MTARLANGFARRDCAPGADGKPQACRTVEPYFAHVSLADLAEDEDRKRLASIPTGLSIGDANVDALIAAGRDAVLCDRDMRRFFASLPNVQMPAVPARCRPYRPGSEAVSADAAKRSAARASRADNP
jgi:hypothetical protein